MSMVEQSVGCRIERLNGVPTPPEAVLLASERQVLQAIKSMATAIQPWIDCDPESPVIMVGLLQGGKFYADRLSDELRRCCSAHFSRADIKVSTRDENGRPLAAPQVDGDIECLRGRRVLIVDDILDSGVTLRLAEGAFRHVASEFRSTVLVQKDNQEVMKAERPTPDYVGLRFLDTRWLSGAGMDMPGDPQGRARESMMIIAYPPIY